MLNDLMQLMKPLTQPPAQTKQVLAPVHINTGDPATQNKRNPFLSAMNTDTKEFRDVYGVNRPLNKPMFLGYRDDKALYGGSKLFILY